MGRPHGPTTTGGGGTHPHGGDGDGADTTHGGDGGDSPRRVRPADAQTVTQAQETTGQAAQAGRPPLALPPGTTSRTRSQVLNTKDYRERWRRGEEWVRELWGGDPEQHYPVDMNDDPDFPVTTPGGRYVDVPVHVNGQTIAVEVKTYGPYRTVEVDGQDVTVKVEVPLSDKIKEQINKDVALRNADPTYDPRWVFVGAPPSPELLRYLNSAGIIANIHG
ncbi:hypothetical protein ACFFX1_00550 [Dactylosporangium sucinum]|uniref:Uncharacterized protein n=1 Tax=Dactylosporangium sucinum TaxID=1424081 RepID=A0A917TGG4_9ACTN|nr:hypothetical protein [Dactylosporangium sucinum]GGM21481.1 hypothetical protein GCM10007977_023230 [Dactylosporangium sucinum]